MGNKKTEAFLKRAIGEKAWIVNKAELADGEGGFFLEGNFIVAGVRRRRYPDEWKFEIYGEEEVEFGDGVQIDDKPWFQQFLEDQNQFHFGFNDLNDPKVIAAFKKIEKRFKKPAKDVTKSRKLNTTKPRALPAKKAAKKPTKRGRGDNIA